MTCAVINLTYYLWDREARHCSQRHKVKEHPG